MTNQQVRDLQAATHSSTLLLQICAAPDRDHSTHFAKLSDDDWAELVHHAITKRITTILDRAVSRAESVSDHLLMPAECRAALNKQRRLIKMSAFAHMIALAEAVRFLKGLGINPIALKGVRLAFVDYPDLQLRPLRDLDLLVPADQAEHAQSAMIASGKYKVAPWSDHYGIEFGHQMPELVDQQHGISIEIHHRLNARDWAQEPLLVQMVFDHAEIVSVGGAQVRVPSMHANFLHLVEHATLHHMFENGPITLADLHFAAQSGKIDWPLLISQADRMGLLRALQLVAALALRNGATWVPAALHDAPEDVQANVSVCTAALLRDDSLTEHAAMLRGIALRKGQIPGWKVALRAAITPTPLKLASIMRVSGANPLRWLGYPIWLVQRGFAYVQARRAVADSDFSLQEAATLRWLREHRETALSPDPGHSTARDQA